MKCVPGLFYSINFERFDISIFQLFSTRESLNIIYNNIATSVQSFRIIEISTRQLGMDPDQERGGGIFKGTQNK